MAEIEEPKAGQSTFELWRIVAQLVQEITALKNISVSPPSAGKAVYSDANWVLKLNAGAGTIKVDDDQDPAVSGHKVDKAAQINFIGPLCTVSDGGGADLGGGQSADVEIGHNTDDLDNAKKYALVISYNDTRWVATWGEVCGTDTGSLALD